MTNKKSTKRALLMSVLSLVLCVTMLMGTTFAWFTDSVTSASNVIMSGNLDIKLEYWNGTEWKDVNGSSELFDANALWEPGYTQVVYLKVSNAGTLALQYKLGVNIISETEGKTKDGAAIKLSDFIYMDAIEGVNGEKAPYADRAAAMKDATQNTLISKGYTKANTLLPVDNDDTTVSEEYVALIVHMPDTVDNAANHNGVNVPKIELGVKVEATQVGNEYDSFGNDYDAGAVDKTYNVLYSFNSAADLLAFAPVEGDAASSGLSIVNGKAQIDATGAWVEIPANLNTNNYVVSYQLDITDLAVGEKVAVDLGEKLGWGNAPITFERGSTKVYTGMDSSGNKVYVDTLDGTVVDVTHTFAYKNDKLEITTVVSDGAKSITATKSLSSPVENTLYWDIYEVSESTGKATMDNFSIKSVIDPWDGTSDISWYDDTKDEFVITTPEELAGLAALVNGGNTFEGKTIKLTEDVDLGNLNWTPIGNTTNYFRGVFDGGEHTVTNMTINLDDPAKDQFAGLFGAIKNAKVNNITVKDSDITAVGKKVRAAAVVGIASSDTSTPAVLELALENVKVEGCDINAEAASGSVLAGGLVGYSYPANLKNVSVSELTINAKAEGNEVRAAAILGYVCGQNISNSGNTRMDFKAETFNVKDVVINADAYTCFAGSYAPYTYYGYITLKNGTVDNLKITVDAHEAFVGGLVGYFWRSDNGHNVSDVNITNLDIDVTTDYLGETRVGGMVGTSQSPNTKYTDCYVSGKIVERCSDPANPVNYHAKVGGFVARTYEYAMQTYTNCVADVDVIGSNVAGGFVGNHNSTVTYVNCEAKGDVTANIAGGFAGRLTEHGYTTDVTFDGCKASGNVKGTNVAGGFIGSTANHGWAAWVAGNGTAYGKNVTIKNCVVAGTVTCDNSDYCAGVIGELKIADGKKIVIENVECAITPIVTPDASAVEIVNS